MNNLIKSHFKARLILFIVFFSVPALSGAARAEFALGASGDILHAKGAYAALLRYDHRQWPLRFGGQAMIWDGPKGANNALTLEYNFGFRQLDLNLGGAYIGNRSSINGTHWNYSFGGAINLGEHYRVQFIHLSNGHNNHRGINEGWNFLGISYRF